MLPIPRCPWLWHTVPGNTQYDFVAPLLVAPLSPDCDRSCRATGNTALFPTVIRGKGEFGSWNQAVRKICRMQTFFFRAQSWKTEKTVYMGFELFFPSPIPKSRNSCIYGVRGFFSTTRARIDVYTGLEHFSKPNPEMQKQTDNYWLISIAVIFAGLVLIAWGFFPKILNFSENHWSTHGDFFPKSRIFPKITDQPMGLLRRAVRTLETGRPHFRDGPSAF